MPICAPTCRSLPHQLVERTAFGISEALSGTVVGGGTRQGRSRAMSQEMHRTRRQHAPVMKPAASTSTATIRTRLGRLRLARDRRRRRFAIGKPLRANRQTAHLIHNRHRIRRRAPDDASSQKMRFGILPHSTLFHHPIEGPWRRSSALWCGNRRRIPNKTRRAAPSGTARFFH